MMATTGSLELRGWKSIAGYLGIPWKTAIQYANKLGLPVRKLGDGRNSPVVAFADELDAWKRRVLKPRKTPN